MSQFEFWPEFSTWQCILTSIGFWSFFVDFSEKKARVRFCTRWLVPQAWSAASRFLSFQACLGLRINAIDSKISLVRPVPPPFLNEARILNLEVANTSVDLGRVRHGQDISVTVLRREGDVEVVVHRRTYPKEETEICEPCVMGRLPGAVVCQLGAEPNVQQKFGLPLEILTCL